MQYSRFWRRTVAISPGDPDQQQTPHPHPGSLVDVGTGGPTVAATRVAAATEAGLGLLRI